MRIITVNLPLSYLKAIDSLTGQKGLYPSRSELIRVAVRDFLLEELNSATDFQKFQQDQKALKFEKVQKIDENLFVNVPGDKTYKLVKK